MSDAARAYVALGANLGVDLFDTLGRAATALTNLPGTRLVALSSAWRSAPVDAGGPDFLNAVAALDTTLAPLAMLDALQAIEHAHGRERPFANAPRTLDLDLLLHGDTLLQTPRLTLPHPRIGERAFVLRPLLEIAPALAHLASGSGWQSQRIERLRPLHVAGHPGTSVSG
ncbi:2-amino-4-hydroxy-6-hydroxymethyldihydropteridine diphosphokinase [Roseateles sp. DC23W]|uniref:2-amino-4-hydroxy-6-hydroxymethyldihydropteridine pyrophosphokinase n=1 Tax=Pelomonas dachongensis TaxID=3299029 RepID=A0ABW7EUE0_9BURK